MNDGDNPYEILDVDPTATTDEIKTAYYRKCREHHPDRGQTEEDIRRRTLLMYKINAARDILLDDKKRQQFDEDLRSNGFYRPDDDQDDDDPGSAYQQQHQQRDERKKPKERPQPGYLGSPYEGPVNPASFFFPGDGRRGDDAKNGKDGSPGQNYGMDDSDGEDASPAYAGEPGADMKIHIRTVVSEDGYFEVFVDTMRGDELVDPTRAYLQSVPLKVFQRVDWTACGGHGGRGGSGGNGGNGYRGSNGLDARTSPFHQRGTDGGPGGDGGNGGRGSNGGDGGRGGDVEIVLDRCDIYLLMRVAGCDPQEGHGSRVKGGTGGARGNHGRGGWGGAGGRGGSSTYYTVERWERRADGEDHLVRDRIQIPGGNNGASGRGGAAPSYPLYSGNDGKDGSFQIRVLHPGGGERLYERRYCLSFVSSTTDHLSEMVGSGDDSNKTYEFGETVFIQSCTVKNTGLMETPSQRVMIAFDQVSNVEVIRQDRLFLPQNSHVTAGNEGCADQGYLRFTCPYPSLLDKGTDFDPVYQDGVMKYCAHQLGPENNTENLSTISDFQEKYRYFHTSSGEVVHMAFPIENRNGVRGIRSLDVNETTLLELSLNNISRQNFGERSATGRALFVQFYYADDKPYAIPLQDVVVRGEEGTIVNIDPTQRPKGHRATIAYLPGNGMTTIRLSFKFTAARPCFRTALQADVYLQKIPSLLPDGSTEGDSKKRLVQRRIFIASCQPKFRHEVESNVVLITTDATNPDQFEAWRSLVEDRLGLRLQMYSLSRYGHINHAEEVEGVGLMDAFTNKLIIVLNEEFVPQHNQARTIKRRPSLFLNSAFDFDPSTRFLFVGGAVDAVEHLSPTATGVNTVISRALSEATLNTLKPNRKTFRRDLNEFLQSERKDGFPSERVTPACFELAVKTRTVFQPDERKVKRILDRRAKNLTHWLRQKDALRPYTVEWCPLVTSTRVEKNTLTSCWEIGVLRVFSGPPRFQNSTYFVGETGTGSSTRSSTLSSPSSIQSRLMLYAVLNAANFDTKIEWYCRSLHNLASAEPQSSQLEICNVVTDCLVTSFVWDVSNYYDGRMKIENAANRSRTLQDLTSSGTMSQLVEECVADEQLRLTVSEHVSTLLAGLRCAAESKDLRPWWSPFSRKYAVCKAMRESIALLEEQWQPIVNEEKIAAHRKTIEESAKLHIKKDRKKMFLRTRGRWRAALSVIHSPTNQDRYPPSPGLSSSAFRVRSQSELSNGHSRKMKAFFAETASPDKAEEMRDSWDKRRSSSQATLLAIRGDVDYFRENAAE